MVAHYRNRWIIALLASLVCVSGYAADQDHQALMIIRFNQQNVPFQRPLYTTLSHALEVYPQAHFQVASISPKAPNRDDQKIQDAKAEHNLEQVEATLKEIGMPQDRFTVTRSRDNLSSSEVRIYVQ